jgi:hypothetical protein
MQHATTVRKSRWTPLLTQRPKSRPSGNAEALAFKDLVAPATGMKTAAGRPQRGARAVRLRTADADLSG